MNMAHTHALLEVNTGVVREAESWELTLSGQESRQASVTCQGNKKRWPRRWSVSLWEVEECRRETREGQAWRKSLDEHSGLGGPTGS